MSKAHPHEKPHHPHWPLTALLFVFVLLLGLFSVHEGGTWIHIKTGAWILAHRAVPRADPFSHTMAGRPWTTSSWLADVVFYVAHKSLGPQGLIALKALTAAAAFSLLLPINPASPLTGVTVLALGALGSWTGLTENPAVFGLLMLALMTRLLRPRKPFRWSTLLLAVLIEVLWANLYGASAAFGVWLALLKTFKTSMRTGSRERLEHAAVPAAVLLGLACNPLGLGLVGHAVAGLGDYGAPWQPVSAWVNLYVLFAAAGLAACFVVLQQEFFLAMTAATLLVFSVLVPVLRPAYILAACPVIALAAGHYLASKPINLPRLARCAAVLAALFWLHWTAIYAPLGTWRGYGVTSIEGALRYLDENGVRGRLFNEAEAGDYVIGSSDRPVFIDDRLSFYNEYEPGFARDASRWPAALAQLTDAYHFDYALVLNRRAGYPARTFDEDPAWRLGYADDGALVYVRRFGLDATQAESLAARAIPPNRLWPDAIDASLKTPRLASRTLDELDRWVVEAPDAVQPLILKAYTLDRLNLSEKAQRWISMAERRRPLSDVELKAMLGNFYARRGDARRAEDLYLDAVQVGGRRGDIALEREALGRLAALLRASGHAERALVYDERARRLAADAAAED